MTTQIEFAENSDQLSAEEVSDNDSEGIDCDINYTNLSNDETIDGSIDESSQQSCETNKNSNENIDSNDFTQNTLKSVTKENEIQSEDNSEIISNEKQITFKNRRSLRTNIKRNNYSINGETDDTDIKDTKTSKIRKNLNDLKIKINRKSNKSDSKESISKTSDYSDNNSNDSTEEEVRSDSSGDINTKKVNKSRKESFVSKFKCDFPNCSEVYPTYSLWNKHRNRHTGKYKCDY